MAIALTPFEALCGFRPVTEIKKFIKGGSVYSRLPGIVAQHIPKISTIFPILLQPNDIIKSLCFWIFIYISTDHFCCTPQLNFNYVKKLQELEMLEIREYSPDLFYQAVKR